MMEQLTDNMVINQMINRFIQVVGEIEGTRTFPVEEGRIVDWGLEILECSRFFGWSPQLGRYESCDMIRANDTGLFHIEVQPLHHVDASCIVRETVAILKNTLIITDPTIPFAYDNPLIVSLVSGFMDLMELFWGLYLRINERLGSIVFRPMNITDQTEGFTPLYELRNEDPEDFYLRGSIFLNTVMRQAIGSIGIGLVENEGDTPVVTHMVFRCMVAECVFTDQLLMAMGHWNDIYRYHSGDTYLPGPVVNTISIVRA